MKGVILAGGKGTRLDPLTRVINKHLLPIGPYPMIYWPIRRLKQAGISQILIITNREDIESFKKVLGSGEQWGVNLFYQIQNQKGGGIADALACAKDFVDDKFVVLLGDNLFDENLRPMIEEFYKEDNKAKILLKEVRDPERYGVVSFDENSHSIHSIVEKPINPPSKYCVTGIYLYDVDVFNVIQELEPSPRGEKEITDLNNYYIKRNELSYDVFKEWWLDAGTHESLYKANYHYYEEIHDTE